MKRFLRRLFLSIYYYEVKHEEKRFFDAWWQFTFTITYVLILLSMVIVNLIMGLFNAEFEGKYYYILGGTILVFDLIFEKTLRRKYEQKLMNQILDLKPIPRWGLYLVVALGFAILIYSFTLIPKSDQFPK